MKKAVLILCHSYNLPFVDVCNQYAELFDKTNYEVSVAYVVGARDEEVERLTVADKVYFLENTSRAVRGLKLRVIVQLLALCRRQHFDLVICHRYKPTYIICLVAVFCKISKIFVVMHDLNTLQSRSRRLFLRLFMRGRVVFAGVSNAVRLDMLRDAKFLAPASVKVLPNVLNVAKFAEQLLPLAQARSALGLAETDFIFGNVGRLVEHKDQHNLLIGFSAIAPHFPQARLVIIGTGKLETELKSLAERLNITSRVLFTGFLAQAFRYMTAFDVYVSSSSQETFGRVLLEAMVAKVPLIATAVNGVPDVIGDAGTLIPAREPAALASAMQDMLALSKTELLARGQVAYQRVSKHFTIEKLRELFLPLL